MPEDFITGVIVERTLEGPARNRTLKYGLTFEYTDKRTVAHTTTDIHNVIEILEGLGLSDHGVTYILQNGGYVARVFAKGEQ